MGKRELKEYLTGLSKAELEIQVMELYGRFGEVKEYYDFAFDPKEEKRIHEAKVRISEEYFPIRRKRAKARRSIARDLFRHFERLGMAPYHLADLLFYHLEIAQAYAKERRMPDAFYKSMAATFKQSAALIVFNGLVPDYEQRAGKIVEIAKDNDWPNLDQFEEILENDVLDGRLGAT